MPTADKGQRAKGVHTMELKKYESEMINVKMIRWMNEVLVYQDLTFEEFCKKVKSFARRWARDDKSFSDLIIEDILGRYQSFNHLYIKYIKPKG
jgi:hypothetical protein